MADVRCPMCSKSNPVEAEACQHCGARIKPLVIQPPDDTLPPARAPQPSSEPSSQTTIVGRAERDRAAAQAVSRPDDALRRAPAPPPPDEAEQAPDEAAGDVPPWLRRLREQTGGPRPQPAPPPAEAESPDWLKRLRDQDAAQPATEAIEPEAPEKPDTDVLRSRLGLGQTAPPPPGGQPVSEPEQAQLPDWLASLRDRAAQSEPPGASADWQSGASGPEVPAPAADAELPDWLKSFSTDAAPEAGAQAAEVPEWLSHLGAVEAQPEPLPPDPAATPSAPIETPAAAIPEASEAQPPVGLPSTAVGEADFDWLKPQEAVRPTGGQGLAPGELPSWLAALSPTGAGPAVGPPPQVEEPAIGGVKVEGTQIQDEDAQAPGSEDLLGGAFRIEEREPGPETDLAKATLPAWLEAMRPVDALRPAAQPVEERVENAGPLAGMRGVLSAEPVVALPRKPGPPPVQLVLSDSQTAQIELLRSLMEAEAQPEPVARRKRGLRVPLDRWLVFILLLAAIVTPIVLGPGFFSLPNSVPAETLAVAELVNSLPTDRPVLVAFDYDPASIGELNAEADSLLQHLASRNLRVVAVSSRPAGAGIGQEVLLHTLTGYEYGVNMVNLGYVPGGAIGLQSLAASPRTAVRAEFTGADPWSMPALNDVEHLSHFSLIAVVTGDPASIRAWVEQVRPLAEAVPLVALISASTEPLVRPYYETQPRQVAGMITGLAGATGYDRVVGLPSEAAKRWDAQSFGLLAATGIIALGNLAYGVAGLLRKPADEESEAEAPEPEPKPKPEPKSKQKKRKR